MARAQRESRFVFRAVATLALCIFAGEWLVMTALLRNDLHLSPELEALLAAAVLAVLTVPSLHFIVVGPLHTRLGRKLEAFQALSRAFDSVQESILVTDRHGVIIRVNPAFTALTGFHAREVVGKTPKVLRSGMQSAAFHQEMWQRISAGLSWQGRVVDRTRDGALIDLHMIVSPVLDSDARVTGYVAIHQDLTTLVQHERELAKLLEDQVQTNADLAHARVGALAASHAKSRFLATVSHELRTPLAGMLGTLELLSGHKLAPEAEECSKLALRSGRALLEVLSDVLDFSRIDAGGMELEAVPFDAAELVQDLREFFGGQAQTRGLSLVIAAPTSGVWLRGDPTRLRQVLTKLTGNALKFTTRGHVTLTMSSATTTPGRHALRFLVEDTGVGIAPETRKHLFEPFVQADVSTTRTQSGTGLGLAICKRLVASMGGELMVESTPGIGSRFFFTVDLPETAPELPRPNTSTAPADRARVAGTRVLVAEDNAVIQIIIVRLLQRLGCEVVLVSDGEAALRHVAVGPPFDLVLMDCQMPRLDGLAATMRIRALGTPSARVPIIALTANTSEEDRRACLAAGMNGFLSKPVSEALLVRALCEIRSGSLDTRPAVAGTDSFRPGPSQLQLASARN